MSRDEHAERFTLLRPLLFMIVYEILGSVNESDDVLLNTLRASARRREEYVGSWLPEPLLLDANDASADVLLRLPRHRHGGGQIRGDGAPGGAPRPRARAGAA